MGIKHFFATFLTVTLLTTTGVSCGHSAERNVCYVFLDLATLYSSYNGEDAQDVLRNASFGDKLELIEQFNDYSKVKLDGETVYIATGALMAEVDFDILKQAFNTNDGLKEKVYTLQGREALVKALQERSNNNIIIPSRPDPKDGYFIHYAFDITDKDNNIREYILFGANDMDVIPSKLCSLSVPNDAVKV